MARKKTYEFDDGGRAASGRTGAARDCLTRAIAIVTGESYDKVWDLVTAKAGAHGDADDGGWEFRAVLAEFGFRCVEVWRTGAKSPAWVGRNYSACIAQSRNHMMAIVDGVVRDAFDSRGYKVKLVWVRD